VFNGRNKLSAYCPYCKTILRSEGAKPIVVGIAGGVSAGKTCLLFHLLYTMKNITHQTVFEFVDEANQKKYEILEEPFQKKRRPQKTRSKKPQTFNFFLRTNRLVPDSIVYLYDLAGEAFLSVDDLNHEYYDYMDKIIFILDPFSIHSVAEKYTFVEEQNKTNITQNNIEDVINRILINFENNYHIKTKERIDTDCIVVINKMDANEELKSQLSEQKIEELRKGHPEIKSRAQGFNMICKDFLIKNCYDYVINILETKFRTVNYVSIDSITFGNMSHTQHLLELVFGKKLKNKKSISE